MYDSFLNQFYHISHFLLAFFVLFFVLPGWLFHKSYEDLPERVVARFLKMVLLLIVVGYLLVSLRLFEVITLVAVFILFTVFNRWRRSIKDSSLLVKLSGFYDFWEGVKATGKQHFFLWMKEKYELFKIQFHHLFRITRIPETVLFLIVLAISVFIRFYDAVTHAALPLSDSYVTLSWMKYIDNRELFHDGIYPQGFHIYLATLYKFAAIDPIYILKYAGPLSGILTLFTLYFFIYKASNNRIAGIMAAFTFGVFIEWMFAYPLERQVATNSQEFSFIFIFPSLYFFLRYLEKGEKRDLLSGFTGTAITGLIHTLGFAYLGMATGLLVLAALFSSFKKMFRRVIHICLVSLGAVVVAVIPYGIGRLMGKHVHSSSAEFLTDQNELIFTAPTLYPMDWIALVSLGIVAITIFFSHNRRLVRIFTVLLGLASFLLYYQGGVWTNSLLISSRSVDLWTLTIPVLLGMAYDSIGLLFKTSRKTVMAEVLVFVSLVMFVQFYLKPFPIEPYKMQRDETLEQYLKISSQFRPKTWAVVSNEEGYAVVLGNGIHMYMETLLEEYDPSLPPLTKRGESQPDSQIPDDIFIFHEKKVFQVSETNSIYPLLKPKYERRIRENQQLVDWIEVYKQANKNIEIFYEDDNLLIYHIFKDKEKNDYERIWGIENEDNES